MDGPDEHESVDESSAPGVSDTTIVGFLPCSLPRKASDVAACSNGMRLQLDERAALPSVELSVHSWPWMIDALADFCDGMVSDPVQLPPVLHNWVRTKTGTWELDTWVGGQLQFWTGCGRRARMCGVRTGCVGFCWRSPAVNMRCAQSSIYEMRAHVAAMRCRCAVGGWACESTVSE